MATHSDLAVFAQTSGLLYFFGIFLAVVWYVLRPANRKTFDDAARVPLDRDEER
jgi:cytochrome c oxidase cbb3-type subunit 4